MPLLGTLVIVVMKGRNLPNKVKIGKQNPFAIIQLGVTKKKTSAIERGGQTPEWDEELRIEIPEDISELATERVAVNRTGGVSALSNSTSADRMKKVPPVSATEGGGARATAYAAEGKRMLRLACYADDARDPTLVGETFIDLDPILRKGASDTWWTLEKRGKFAGEIYLEMTWYLNQLDIPSDYPDADLQPLTNSISTMSISQKRGSLPLPPVNGHGHGGKVSDAQWEPQHGFADRRASYGAPPPAGGYLPPRSPSVVHQQVQHHQHDSYGAGGGEFDALAQQHYANQSYSQPSSSTPYNQPVPPHAAYAPPPIPQAYSQPYSTTPVPPQPQHHASWPPPTQHQAFPPPAPAPSVYAPTPSFTPVPPPPQAPYSPAPSHISQAGPPQTYPVQSPYQPAPTPQQSYYPPAPPQAPPLPPPTPQQNLYQSHPSQQGSHPLPVPPQQPPNQYFAPPPPPPPELLQRPPSALSSVSSYASYGAPQALPTPPRPPPTPDAYAQLAHSTSQPQLYSHSHQPSNGSIASGFSAAPRPPQPPLPVPPQPQYQQQQQAVGYGYQGGNGTQVPVHQQSYEEYYGTTQRQAGGVQTTLPTYNPFAVPEQHYT
ncbi:hypothetical protein MNV49_001315 [Pseudohyphozyma bogoriensis]|nr:hypothetical protein MNV49_001315 [Pseudohyphozyma bogoriensis]